MRRTARAAFEVGDATATQTGPFREFLLRQTRRQAYLPQQDGELT
jgi:hypothetical protein